MGLRNKRGIFFMMLAIVILSIFVISITFFSGYALRKSTQQRVESLSDFVNSVESDIQRQLFILGARSVFLMQNEMVYGSPHFIGEGNTENYLQEIFFNGTINGRSEAIISGVTFSDLQTSIDDDAKGISATIQLSNPEINVTQEDPWNILVSFSADFYVSDNNGLASWNKSLTSFAYIGISNFTDPLYVATTNGEVDPDIITAPAGATIAEHIHNGYYLNYSGAPSFIDRLEGNFGDDAIYPEYGIVSLVKTSEIPDNYVHPGRPIVDYIYFSNLAYSPCTTNGVLLTQEHKELYGVVSCS